MEVIGGVLARAAKRYPVQLCGFAAASNHLHLLCRARDGALSRFMQYVLVNVAKKAGPLVGWRSQLWERRFSAEQVLDDAALEGRLVYILSHGVKEGLVERVTEWPGLSCLPQLLGSGRRTFHFFEWARRWSRGKLVEGGGQRWSRAWATPEELELQPIPSWEGWTPERRHARVREMVRQIEAAGRERYPSGPRGLESVLQRNPLRPPRKTKRTPRPLFHATDTRLLGYFKELYDRFVADFKEASAMFRVGRWAEAHFPPFAFRPPVQLRV
jgi:hypothetical protein